MEVQTLGLYHNEFDSLVGIFSKYEETRTNPILKTLWDQFENPSLVAERWLRNEEQEVDVILCPGAS